MGDSQRWADGTVHGLGSEVGMLSWKERLEQDKTDESGKMNPNLAVRLIIPLFPQMKY